MTRSSPNLAPADAAEHTGLDHAGAGALAPSSSGVLRGAAFAAAAPDPLDGMAETFNRAVGSAIAQFTRGTSPATLAQSFADWWMHLAVAPGKQLQLASKSIRKGMRLADYAGRSLAGPPTRHEAKRRPLTLGGPRQAGGKA